MKKTSSLAERISNRFEQHRHDLVDKQQQLDSRMKEMLEQRERLAAIAKSQIESVVLPRMEELARHFDNANVMILMPIRLVSANLPIPQDTRPS